MIISNKERKESQEYLHKLFSYDGKDLIWKVQKSNNIKVGSIAGNKQKNGYNYIGIDGKIYFAHRLIWMFVYGYLPENQIDHVNRIKDDNRIENLREVSNQCNIQNAGMSKNNTSGIKGVHWCKRAKRWVAQITVNDKNKNLGKYKNKIDAAKARYQAEIKYDWASCEAGKSSAKQFIDANVI